MADQLTLSEAYSDMTSAWTKGGQYRVELLITQTSEPGKPFTATVDEVTDYGDVEPVEPPAKPNAKKAKEAKY